MSHSKNHGIQPMYKWMMAINDFIIIIIIITSKARFYRPDSNENLMNQHLYHNNSVQIKKHKSPF